MVEFMAYTGLRAAEVSGLEVADIVFAPSPRPRPGRRPHTARAAGSEAHSARGARPVWFTVLRKVLAALMFTAIASLAALL